MSVPAIEPIRNFEAWASHPALTADELSLGIERALHQIDCNLYQFGTELYPSPATYDKLYHSMLNTEWTNGFWTGMLWLAYELTGDITYADVATRNVASFVERVEKLVELDHHDLGFLYTPSCVAAYKLTGNEDARRAALLAADQLCTRWREKGQFIQAWGPLNSAEHYRLIIDCLLNVPLLWWASEETGDAHYADIARAHVATTMKYIIREDGSAYHTFYMNPEDGSPVRGATRQGYSDSSAWARGQAWGMYGIPLNLLADNSDAYLDHWRSMRNYYLNRQPQDLVAMWDLIFTEQDDQSRDSSAAAIAVCGLQASAGLPLAEDEHKLCQGAANGILRSLINNYTGKVAEQHVGHPVLYHGVYSWHSGKGVDEGNIWGDYFFMEALVRASNLESVLVKERFAMGTPNIVMTRIDERLVHGQGQLWIKALGVNTVIVANDEAAADPLAQTLMKTVIPKSVAMRFFTLQKTIDVIHKAAPAQTIFLLVKDPKDALTLVAGGVPVTKINVGNIHNAEGKEKVTRSIFLGPEDKAALKEMMEVYNVEFNTQTTPSGTDGAVEVDLKQYV